MAVSLGLVGIYELDQGIREKFGFVEEKPAYAEILPEINLHCYNVNWFNNFGFQIVFTETIVEIGETLASYDIDFSNEEFFNDKRVVDYLVINCPHVDSRLELPDEYNAFIGMDALDKCLQVKEGIFDSEGYCLQFKK